ncbi:MAG TPA: DUF167 family protein [Patescibacteria group bacterium]|nr:DUF167 family protein [Patescibacteria group bacterium]
MKLAVTVHPNSRQPRIRRDEQGGLHVYVSPPPHEGRANAAALQALAAYVGVKRSQVRLVRGGTDKHKIFEILS